LTGALSKSISIPIPIPMPMPITRQPEPTGDTFAQRLVRWQLQHGRHDLPWQGTRDPYRVWLSEIMLQQTQVATVKRYFSRFMERFPDVHALAQASEDAVLGLWSGLGYYTRARNVHRCARAVVDTFGGTFPHTVQELERLPGIGRSTAAAIASLCYSQREAILDANVRRVLTRVCGFSGDLARAEPVRALWNIASELLPPEHAAHDMPAYTQGLMDLGATLCLPRNPACDACPQVGLCQAHADGNAADFPVRSRTLKRSSQALWMLLARDCHGAVFLTRRPAKGIWAGLYCLPVFSSAQELRDALTPQAGQRLQELCVFTHVLTHKDLLLQTLLLDVSDRMQLVPLEPVTPGHSPRLQGQWVAAPEWPTLGLPAPVRRLLEDFTPASS